MSDFFTLMFNNDMEPAERAARVTWLYFHGGGEPPQEWLEEAIRLAREET